MTAGAFFSTSIMNSTPESSRRSTAMATPLSEENYSIEASPIYSSPVSATTPQGPGYQPAGLVGLGISGLDDSGPFPNVLSYPVSPTIANQLAPLDSLYSMPLKVDDYSTASFFPVYGDLHAAPHSPRSPYESQAMSASPSYNSSLEVNTGQRTQSVFPLQAQAPGYWASTSCMGSTSPLEPVSAMEKSAMESQWSQLYYPEASITVNPPALPVGRASYASATSANVGIRTRLGQFPTMNQPDNPTSITSGELAIHESPSKAPKRRTSPKRQSQKDKDKGYACRLCGYVFTRRSNCMEHQKKHDPRSRESHPCNECDKTFGRKADLKRHLNNIHRGLRKHTCNWCERRFSRPEALHKHLNDCDRRLHQLTLSSLRNQDSRFVSSKLPNNPTF